MNGRILIQNGSGISRATLYGVFNTAMIFYIGATQTTIVIYVIYTTYFLPPCGGLGWGLLMELPGEEKASVAPADRKRQ